MVYYNKVMISIGFTALKDEIKRVKLDDHQGEPHHSFLQYYKNTLYN